MVRDGNPFIKDYLNVDNIHKIQLGFYYLLLNVENFYVFIFFLLIHMFIYFYIGNRFNEIKFYCHCLRREIYVKR